jgi:hypothetical protein
MAMVNPWLKFKNLLPDTAKQIVTVQTVNTDGTSIVQLRSGDLITVSGNSISTGNKAVIQGGRITGPASNLPYSDLTV